MISTDNLVCSQLEQLAEEISILVLFSTALYGFRSTVLYDCGLQASILASGWIVLSISLGPAESLKPGKIVYTLRKSHLMKSLTYTSQPNLIHLG